MKTFKVIITITTDDETDASYVEQVVESVFEYNGSEHVDFKNVESVEEF